jgi:hypothetical protein
MRLDPCSTAKKIVVVVAAQLPRGAARQQATRNKLN